VVAALLLWDSGALRLSPDRIQQCNSGMYLCNREALNSALCWALNCAPYHTWWSHAASSSYTCIPVFHWHIIVWNLSHDFENGKTSHNQDIFTTANSIDCHSFRVIHFQRSISCYAPPVIHLYQVPIHILPPSIFRRDPSCVIHHWQETLFGHNPSPAKIHLLL